MPLSGQRLTSSLSFGARYAHLALSEHTILVQDLLKRRSGRSPLTLLLRVKAETGEAFIEVDFHLSLQGALYWKPHVVLTDRYAAVRQDYAAHFEEDRFRRIGRSG